MQSVTRLFPLLLCVALLAGINHAGAAHAQQPSPMEIGRSAKDRPIMAYRFGNGPVKRALIGGIHGGYELNTIRLMSETIAHLGANPGEIPAHVTLYVVPMMNPDGFHAGTDRINGRMNGNRVDLNRNWDFNWRQQAWHGRWPVSGGSAPFSEPETRAVRDFIMDQDIDAVIFYHSAFAAVFAGANRHLSQTELLAKVIAGATGYPFLTEGIPRQIMSGNAIDWLTGQGIHAIEIELTNNRDIEWERNLRGVRAFLKWAPVAADDADSTTHRQR